jgi:hypothetical protein
LDRINNRLDRVKEKSGGTEGNTQNKIQRQKDQKYRQKSKETLRIEGYSLTYNWVEFHKEKEEITPHATFEKVMTENFPRLMMMIKSQTQKLYKPKQYKFKELPT